MNRTRGIGALVIAASAVVMIGGGVAIHSRKTPTSFVAAPANLAAVSVIPAPTVSAPAKPSASPSVAAGAEAYAKVSKELKSRGKHAAVAAIDLTTGATVMYNQTVGFHTASIIKVDILATVLLRHQKSHTSLSSNEKALATKMITQSDNDAATALYKDAGGAAGLTAANKTFKLTNTKMAGGDWGSTLTTAGDQLKLLRLLATSASPLTATSRAYELGLMKKVIPSQRWGVPTAASDDATAVYNKNGWYPFSADHGAWTINSLGEIVESGHTYLVAALSNNNASQTSGEKVVGHAATVAISGLSGP